MSDGEDEEGDDLEFAYSPEQQLTTEQRLELLELQVAQMQAQVGALLKQLPWLSASRKN